MKINKPKTNVFVDEHLLNHASQYLQAHLKNAFDLDSLNAILEDDTFKRHRHFLFKNCRDRYAVVIEEIDNLFWEFKAKCIGRKSS